MTRKYEVTINYKTKTFNGVGEAKVYIYRSLKSGISKLATMKSYLNDELIRATDWKLKNNKLELVCMVEF